MLEYLDSIYRMSWYKYVQEIAISYNADGRRDTFMYQ